MPLGLNPTVSFDVTELERAVRNFCVSNSITTQAGFDAAVNALTAAQQTAAVKALLRCLVVT